MRRAEIGAGAARSGMRRGLVALGALCCFAALSARLVTIGSGEAPGPALASSHAQPPEVLSRPDIVDRNGVLLATDVPTHWLFADPRLVVNPDETAELLAEALPGLSAKALRQKLSAPSRFVWIKRGLAPREAAAVHSLGLPGLFWREQPARAYPASEALAFLLGYADLYNRGRAGVERAIDENPRLARAAPAGAGRSAVRLTIDIRLQHALEAELAAAQALHRAKAASGLLLQVNTGEVLAYASLPAFDPHDIPPPSDALATRDRLAQEVYQLGSVFKPLTAAMALDYGLAKPQDEFDVATPLVFGRYALADKRAAGQYASVSDILAKSSNTGAARIGLYAGPIRQREFLRRLGLLDALATDIGPTARPVAPRSWSEIDTAVISYGHTLAVSPLAFAAAAATLVNGGLQVRPSFIQGEERAGPAARRLMKASTSEAIRGMLRRVVEDGTARRLKAMLPGYDFCGKTGTAYKPRGGGYGTEVITSFFVAFPADKPQYLLFVMLDEPQPTEGANTDSANNAVPLAGAILKRALPMLGFAPQPAFDETRLSAY